MEGSGGDGVGGGQVMNVSVNCPDTILSKRNHGRQEEACGEPSEEPSGNGQGRTEGLGDRVVQAFLVVLYQLASSLIYLMLMLGVLRLRRGSPDLLDPFGRAGP
jgi:hypothetical protein